MPITARIWDDPLQIFVTGTQDPEAARPAALEAMAGWADENVYPLEDGDLTADQFAKQWLAAHPPRLSAGRIVPCIPGDDYSWYWWEGHRLDRPGAFFALIYGA